MSVFIDKLREELEDQEFPNMDLKKAVFRLLNLKEDQMISRSTESPDPPEQPNDKKPKPDGGPTEEEILSDSINSELGTIRGNLKTSIEKLLELK